MWTRRGLIVLALGGLLAGCGQQQSQRAAVADYLKHVDRIEKQLATPLSKVTTTGSQFAQEQRSGGSLTGLLPASQAQTLFSAWSQIELLRSHLAALRAPPPAAHLRSLLLEVVDGQAKLTRELAKLVVFLPGYARALRPLAPAMRRLEDALSGQTATGSAALAGKAAALHQFQASLDRILGQLRRLQPPAVSRPDYNGQLAALKGMRTTAGELATALQGGSQTDLSQLLTKFDRAATSTETIAAQKARIAAARAYDGESSRLAQLSQDAEAERLRLANSPS
jgi:hypothetical protein